MPVTVCGIGLLLQLSIPGSAPAQGVVVFGSDRCAEGGEPGPPNYVNPSDPRCRGGIWRVNDDGSELHRLTNGVPPEPGYGSYGGGDGSPSWSPDARRIVFLRGGGGQDRRPHLFVMNADGSEPTRLLRDPLPDGYLEETNPDWSPDGARIVFDSYRADPVRGFAHAIFSVDADGSNLKRLTPLSGDAWQPAFSPDGREIVFFDREITAINPGRPPTTDGGVYLMNLDGGGRTRLTAGDAGIAANGVSFSPDGRHLAFLGVSAARHPRLYTMSIDGSHVRAVAEGAALDPVWTPFGPSIIYGAAVLGGPVVPHRAIMKVDLSSDAPPVALTDRDGIDSGPDWQLPGGVAVSVRKDRTPPIAQLLERLERVPGPRSSSASRGGNAAAKQGKGNRLPFMAVDRSGIRKVSAAIGRRKSGRCRFLEGGKLGSPRSCSKRVFEVVPNAEKWRARVKRLPAGTYEVSFRIRDVKGNVTRDPRPQTVRLDS